ncbi:MAG: hypothetical protein H7318_07220 [Oligoflexus sp.]|nr:hypothetical protein [Oligoflexus sp.]
MKSLLSLSLSLSLLTISCTPAAGALSQLKQALSPAVDPLGMSVTYKRNFERLPASGQVSEANLPWSDSNWPSKFAGIANRWALNGEEQLTESHFEYDLKTFEQLSRMDISALQKLSPAEKFDIYAGRYDYPTVKSEWERNRPDADDSESLEHGWASAALNFGEPSAIQVVNEDGVEIEFTASDIKALLSYYQGQLAYARTVLLGEHCRVEFDRFSAKACKETNAGAFHLVLTNELGLKSQGFVMDNKVEGETHNYPVHGYSSVIEKDNLLPLPNATAGTVREVEVRTTVTYSNVTEPSQDATNGSPLHSDKTVTYHYLIELDARGLVIGGSWLDQEKPDFMWRQDRPAFEKEFSKLGKLYESAIAK